MPDDLERGLFFPGDAAATAVAAPPASAPARPVAADPSAEAAARVLTQPKRSMFSRRLALRWAGWGSILLVLAGWGNGFLSFFRPQDVPALPPVVTGALPPAEGMPPVG